MECEEFPAKSSPPNQTISVLCLAAHVLYENVQPQLLVTVIHLFMYLFKLKCGFEHNMGIKMNQANDSAHRLNGIMLLGETCSCGRSNIP